MRKRICLILLTAPLMAAAVTYSYDSAGRLVSADYGATGAITYAYDNAGNLTSRSVQAGGSAAIASVNSAGGGSEIAPDTRIETKGMRIVPANTQAGGVIWSDAPGLAPGRLPTQLKAVSVTVSGKPAYVYSYCNAVTSRTCAKDQIDMLTPLDDREGPVEIIVKNGTAASAPLAPAARSRMSRPRVDEASPLVRGTPRVQRPFAAPKAFDNTP